MNQILEFIFDLFQSFIALSIGLWFNKKYQETHSGELGIELLPGVLQLLFSCGLQWSEFFKFTKSDWHTFWVIGCLITYSLGCWMCWKNTKKQYKTTDGVFSAMLAQIFIPMGLTMPVLYVCAVIGALYGELGFLLKSKFFWWFVILAIILLR